MTSSFELEAASKLPLADAVLRILNSVLEPVFLDAIFEANRGRSFARDLAFPTFVHLMAESLTGCRGSANQTFLRAIEARRIGVTRQAMFQRLGSLPLAVSVSFLAEASERVRQLGLVECNALPASLSKYRVVALDGKKLKYVQHRLKPVRGVKGHVYGGKLVVAFDLRTKQVVCMEAVADGEAADQPLIPGTVARLPASTRPNLYVFDRAASNRNSLNAFSRNGDTFVVRYSRAIKFHLDSRVDPRTGRDDVGRDYVEEWGWLGEEADPLRVRVRRISVTRSSSDLLAVVTNLEDADAFPAGDLLSLYRQRWCIETCFREVVQTFDLRNFIGSSPRATVFEAAFCLLLYNITLLVKCLVAGRTRSPEDVSTKLLYDEMLRELTSWHTLLSVDQTVRVIESNPLRSPEELIGYLTKILGSFPETKWKKAPKQIRKPKPARKYLKGGHSSAEKIINDQHRLT
jgi:Transposase DDE domain